MFVELSRLAGRVTRAGVSSSLGSRLFFMPLFTGVRGKGEFSEVRHSPGPTLVDAPG
jgi:hypothetical protein